MTDRPAPRDRDGVVPDDVRFERLVNASSVGPAYPPHLVPTLTDRGFTHLPPVIDDDDADVDRRATVRAYESSAAEGPRVWLSLDGQNARDAAGGAARVLAHLPATRAWHLAEQLMTLVRGHYAGDATPVDPYYHVATLGEVDDSAERVERAARALFASCVSTGMPGRTWESLTDDDRAGWRERVARVVHTLVTDPATLDHYNEFDAY